MYRFRFNRRSDMEEKNNRSDEAVDVPSTQITSGEKNGFFQIELERDDVTEDEMREVGEFLVYDENGNRHKLSDLSNEFKTVFVFIRVSHIFVLQAIIYCILDLYLQLHFRACCVLQRLNMLKVNFIVTGKSEYEY